jgi:hypothetical protein
LNDDEEEYTLIDWLIAENPNYEPFSNVAEVYDWVPLGNAEWAWAIEFVE